MQGILDFLNSFLDILYNSFSWALNALLKVIPFTLLLILEGFFSVISLFISTLDIGNLAVAASASWGFLPASVAYLISMSGIPTGLNILALAWTIRFLLNLIPAAFTRI